MLLELLNRDLRLHYDALLLPFLFALVMAGLYPFNPELPIFGPVLGFVFAAFLPLIIHLREHHAGSLAELVGLPVARHQIVQARMVEGFLLPTLLLILSNLVIALITRTWPSMPPADLMRFLGWALFWCFGFFLPFVLRWDGMGLAAAFGILFTLGTALSLTQFLPPQIHFGIWNVIQKIVVHFGTHTHQHTLLLLTLFALSFHLATRALAARDL
ncbi:MAG: ABC-2 transporter permease [Holophaga sp.]|nr:ABC-2 transporter permease [Holophaga sp.]